MTPAGKVRFAFFMIALLTLMFGVIAAFRGVGPSEEDAVPAMQAPTPSAVASPTPPSPQAADTAAMPSDLPVRAEEMQPMTVYDDQPRLAPPLPLDKGKLAWEAKVEGVTEDQQLPPAAKAKRLLEMIPTLPVESWQTVSEEAVHALPDKDYNAAVLPVVSNAGTNGVTLSVLFTDLMERPDSITLPALLSIARQPGHPFAPYALDNLNLLLNESHGSDWAKWDESIRRALAKHQ